MTRLRTWPFRILAVIALAVAGFLLGGFASASAHSGLVSSDPRDGAELAAPPAKVSLVFGEDLLPDFVNFTISSATGEPITITGVNVSGATAVIPWPTDAPGGSYTVAYRVVSQDGHPVSGAISFSYIMESPTPTPTSVSPSPSSSSAAPSTSASGSPVPSPTDTSTAQPTSASGSATSTSAPDVDPASSSASSVGWIIAGVAIVLLAIIAIIALVARRR